MAVFTAQHGRHTSLNKRAPHESELRNGGALIQPVEEAPALTLIPRCPGESACYEHNVVATVESVQAAIEAASSVRRPLTGGFPRRLVLLLDPRPLFRRFNV